MDRWSEAVIENSYGRVSLLPQPVVLPTLYMPKEVAAGLNSFTYSESLVQQHLSSLGYDMYRDFHTILVSEAASTDPGQRMRRMPCRACAAGMWEVSTGLLVRGCCASPLLLQVLSPLPQFINPGNTAWAAGGGSPMIYVMRCNPQHYYLLHEIGHRFGMPHATIYKLANETATPTVTRAGHSSMAALPC